MIKLSFASQWANMYVVVLHFFFRGEWSAHHGRSKLEERPQTSGAHEGNSMIRFFYLWDSRASGSPSSAHWPGNCSVFKMAEWSSLHSYLVVIGLGKSVKYIERIKAKTRGQTTLGTKYGPSNRKIVNTFKVLKASSKPFPFHVVNVIQTGVQ